MEHIRGAAPKLSRTPGRPLATPVRRELERSLGRSLLGVRVRENAAVPAGADAAAVGDDLHFAPGRFRPDLPEGRELLLHELVHHEQQARGLVPGAGAVNPDPALEADADRRAARAAQGRHAPAMPVTGPHAPGAVQLGRWGRGKQHRQTRKYQPPVTPQPDPDPMHFQDMPEGPVRVYRVEPGAQTYDKKGRAMYSHVHVHNHNAHVYMPKPQEEYSVEGERNNRTFKRPTGPKGVRSPQQFLTSQRDTGRNKTWINFGQPQRALDFYNQKSVNEPHLNWSVKSFQVPHESWTALRDQAVHEREARTRPTRPINVDRKAPNQLGLGERHIDLLNSTMIEGSARNETPHTLTRRVNRKQRRN